MSYLTAVLLGLVQGITEFFPVSSSGHLTLLQTIFHVEGADLFFDVLLHLGSLMAILAVYRREIAAILRGGLGIIGFGPDRGKITRDNADRRRMAVFLAVGTVPLLLALPLRPVAERISESPSIVSLMLLVTGTILYLSDRFSRGTQGLREASAWKALLVGVSQAVSVIPGISRSGATISTGMFFGFRRSFALHFSFLLSVPAVLGAAVVSLVGAMDTGIQTELLPKYLCGMLAAAVSGYFSIRFLRYLAARSHFGGFAYYCWGAGLVALMLSLVA